jgi:hypothetical protein
MSGLRELIETVGVSIRVVKKLKKVTGETFSEWIRLGDGR